MKKYLFMAMIAAASMVGAGEEYKFDKVSDWLPSRGITQGEDGLRVKNQVMMQSKKLFDIVPGKVYKLKLKAKRISGDPAMIYFGFDMYRPNGKTVLRNEHVASVPGSLCRLAKDVKKGDTVIYLDKTASKWKKYSHTFIAINAKKDFSDLPNYNLLRAPIKSIEKCAEGYKVTLSSKSYRAIPKGTAVRQHLSGGYMYSGGYKLLKDKEIELKGKVDGILPKGPGYSSKKWSSYAAKARVIILANWSGKGTVAEFDDIELEIEDKK